MPTASQPVLRVDLNKLRWKVLPGFKIHFEKHSSDCLETPESLPLKEEGYRVKITETLRHHRFLLHARIEGRELPGTKTCKTRKTRKTRRNKPRKWAFAPNLFCVALDKNTDVVITAYHNHLDYGQFGHKLFENAHRTDALKQDAFLAWLKKGEDVATSAKVMLGTNVSHEITDVERLIGF